MSRPIMHATDFSLASRAAFAKAVELADSRGTGAPSADPPAAHPTMSPR